jgi:hypothetical protein
VRRTCTVLIVAFLALAAAGCRGRTGPAPLINPAIAPASVVATPVAADASIGNLVAARILVPARRSDRRDITPELFAQSPQLKGVIAAGLLSHFAVRGEPYSTLVAKVLGATQSGDGLYHVYLDMSSQGWVGRSDSLHSVVGGANPVAVTTNGEYVEAVDWPGYGSAYGVDERKLFPTWVRTRLDRADPDIQRASEELARSLALRNQ